MCHVFLAVNLFFLVSNMHTGMTFITSHSLNGEWEWIGILDVVPNITGFFSLKTNSPKTSEGL